MTFRLMAPLAALSVLMVGAAAQAAETKTAPADPTAINPASTGIPGTNVPAAGFTSTNGATAEQSAANPATAELIGLVNRIKARLREGARTETELAPEIRQFDELLAKYGSEKTDPVATILTAKAMLYLEIFTNSAKAIEYIRQSKHEFPETRTGKEADAFIAMIEHQQRFQTIQRSQVAGSIFPDFQEKDLDGKPVSVSAYKGKVLLVDFWATWCTPCMMELPNVLAAYEKYHPRGLEIIGITLDFDERALRNFLKTKGVPWQQFFEGKPWDNRWENKLVQKYAVDAIPCTFLLDRQGRIVAKDLKGEELPQALEALLPPPPPPPKISPTTLAVAGGAALLIVVGTLGLRKWSRAAERPKAKSTKAPAGQNQHQRPHESRETEKSSDLADSAKVASKVK